MDAEVRERLGLLADGERSDAGSPPPTAATTSRPRPREVTGPIPPQLAISLFAAPATTSTRPDRRTFSWSDLVARFSNHERRRTKDGRGWSGATYRPGTTRSNANVVEWSVVGADIEHVTLDEVQQLREHLRGLGIAYAMYSTFGFDPVAPRVRVTIPLTRPVPAEQYPDVWRRANHHIFLGLNDPQTKDASRMLYEPAAPEDAAVLAEAGEGLALDWERLPPVPAVGPTKGASTKRGEDVGIGWATLEFIALGVPKGQQRGRALAATRALLAAGKSIEETAEKVWQGLQASECGDPNDPWTYEHALAFAEDLTRRDPTKLEKGASLILDMSDGGFYRRDTSVGDIKLKATVPAAYANGRAEAGPEGRPSTGDQAPAEPVTRSLVKPESETVVLDAEPRFERTEMGTSEMLIWLHGDDLRFCHPWSCWLAWDGRRFRRDLTGEARRRAKATIRKVYGIAGELEDDKKRHALVAWARQLEKAATVAAMLKLAESEPGIPILPDDMDADPFHFNVWNGTVDLRTGELRPHDRADRITKLAPVASDPRAECPTFLRFLERVLPDEEVRAFLRRAIGYSLTGDTSAQCLFFLYGSGANGKSTLLIVLLELLGEYGKQAAPDLLTHKSAERHPTELADLFGARLVTSVEVDEGKRLAETLIKQMTGGDRMKGRFMRADFFEWLPTHKLFLAANHRPTICGTDYAIWRRIHLVPFTVTIPEDERDRHLPVKLRAELPGILNWAIRGCLEWQRDGLGLPKAVKEATTEYRAEQDVLGDFIAERCVEDEQATVTAKALWDAWRGWCEQAGEQEGTQRSLGPRLGERGFEQARGAKGVRQWRGLRLRGPDEMASGDASGQGDAKRRGFPDERQATPSREEIGKSASQASPDPDASPDQSAEGLCSACRRILGSDELPCAYCRMEDE